VLAYRTAPSEVGQYLRWDREGIRAAFEGLAHNRWGGVGVIAVVLGLLLVGGWALALRERGLGALRGDLAVPAALAVGAVVFLTFARQSRYVYLVVALLLPALAVAADAVVRRWRVATPAVVVLLLAGVPGNVQQFYDGPDVFPPEYFDGQEAMVLALAHTPLVAEVDPSARPMYGSAPDLSAGWLRRGGADGKIPEPGAIPPSLADEVVVRLSLSQDFEEIGDRRCEPIAEPTDAVLHQGDVVRIAGGATGDVSVRLAEPRDPRSFGVPFRFVDEPWFGGKRLVVEVPELHVQLLSPDPLEVCR
jgi:hypothetical protein